MAGWVGVDLDGVLARYEGFKGSTRIGMPVPAMVERVRRWLSEGIEVRVFTARMSEPNPRVRAEIAQAIRDWTRAHIGTALEATCVKDYAMDELWDDRAVAVEANTGRVLNPSRRGLE